MTRRISLVTATIGMALAVGVPAAWGDKWAADKQNPTIAVSPEGMLDARERALGVSIGNGKVGPLEARERSFAAKQDTALISAQYPDWFERAAAATTRANPDPVVDDRFHIASSSTPVPVTVGSGRELEWPQIGIGFSLGIVLMLGLYLVTRTRQRPLAH